MLPNGWKLVALRALIERLDSGVSVNGEDRLRLPGEVGVLKISAVTSGTFDSSEHKAVGAGEEEKVRISPRAGRILVSRSNTAELVGASVYVQEDRPTLFLPDKLWQLEPKKAASICMLWLAQWFSFERTRLSLSKLATGTSGSMKNISKEALLAMQVELPPTQEQERIAEVLALWTKAVGVSERLLANSRMQRLSLLSKVLHVPAATTEVADRDRSNSLPPSVRAGIPKLPATPAGWNRVNLGAHLREIRRPLALAPDHNYALVTVKRSRGGVQKRGIFRGDEVKTPSQFIVKAGDFLISKRQIVHGACGVVPPELDGAIVSNEYAVLNSDGQIDLDFLRYLSESIYFQQTCFHSSIGVHVEKMIFKTERWLAWPFNLPPLAEQRRIVEILDAAASEVTSIEQQITALKQEKRALMQQLLTGKRRVRLPEVVEAASA